MLVLRAGRRLLAVDAQMLSRDWSTKDQTDVMVCSFEAHGTARVCCAVDVADRGKHKATSPPWASLPVGPFMATAAVACEGAI